ncbi:MAG TPA: AmmeMemoRadiSam system protein A [Gammaproteobacteria bacterium]|nr:AmmeMemoRadiSam system protein A [Gammaproteobacteria bacterium]
MIDHKNQNILLDIARASISNGLKQGRSLPIRLGDYPSALQAPRASFVTLQINAQLRGCIGSLEAFRPLVEDVAENAFAAAFRDPRFPPVTEKEFDQLDYHISILSPSEPLEFKSENDLLNKLRPGVDGLVLEEGGRRGTFLPSVWESLPHPRQFLAQLKVKAGLPADYWSNSIKVKRYVVEDVNSGSQEGL